ncbi:glycosyltransferase family 4 protein [Chitinophaga agrisoli]|uniref:Glycosyltransferase family 4 protein n=1 Tax=Chitinophaga agrisoli TaxID=2607653 RepID=A0A5B2VHY0_9BACT|nr:glycosyltransferase [Chitinophaga agrisoli]KAA2239193.1 glycosyltransferase family 4 protein [Chitinophaga agrisoli]
MTKNIKDLIVIFKGNITQSPPQLNFLQSANDLGIRLRLICADVAADTLQYLQGSCPRLEVINLDIRAKGKDRFSKLAYWYKFRKRVWDYLKRQAGSYDALWIGSADTALCLGKKLQQEVYYLNVLELYDTLPWHRKLLRNYARNALAVVVPEYNRACIFRTWWGLRKTPFILPNAPYNIEVVQKEDMAQRYQEIISNLEQQSRGRKIILYQGLITPRRRLDEIAAAVGRLSGEDYLFVVLGPQYENYVEQLKAVNPATIWIPAIPAPYHLIITQMAYIGIVVYNYTNLNNIFCAPNKIWEYSYVSKPMICNDIPGLRFTVEYNKAGVCINTEDIESVVGAIRKIDGQYTDYTRKANEFFSLSRYKDTVSEILTSKTVAVE